jgi:hypothetical protein
MHHDRLVVIARCLRACCRAADRSDAVTGGGAGQISTASASGPAGALSHHKSVYFKFFRDVGLGQAHDFSSHAADALGLMAVSYIEPATSRAFHRPIKYPNLGWPNGADCYPTEGRFHR